MVRAGPENDFSLHMTDTPATGLKVSVTGRSADGTGLGRTDLAGNKGGGAKTQRDQKHFLFEANLDRLVMRRGVTLAPFAFSTSGIGDSPQTLALSGMLSNAAQLSGDLVVEKGERRVRLRTNNAGLLLKGLFGFTSIRGGKLNMVAALSPVPTKQELADRRAPDYRGELTINDFTIVNQPFLTRLFSAGSLGGLIDLLGGNGIAVDRLQAPFSMHDGVLNIREARASGPSIGLTAQGYLDRRKDKIGLEGALAPIYGLNSVLGAIPLLGDVLVSQKGEGIIGMSYSVSGNADEPKISVNPLSVLTPGILRRIFEGTPEAPRAVAAKRAKPAAKDEPAGKDDAAAKDKAGTAAAAPKGTPAAKTAAPPANPKRAPADTPKPATAPDEPAAKADTPPKR